MPKKTTEVKVEPIIKAPKRKPISEMTKEEMVKAQVPQDVIEDYFPD